MPEKHWSRCLLVPPILMMIRFVTIPFPCLPVHSSVLGYIRSYRSRICTGMHRIYLPWRSKISKNLTNRRCTHRSSTTREPFRFVSTSNSSRTKLIIKDSRIQGYGWKIYKIIPSKIPIQGRERIRNYPYLPLHPTKFSFLLESRPPLSLIILLALIFLPSTTPSLVKVPSISSRFAFITISRSLCYLQFHPHLHTFAL